MWPDIQSFALLRPPTLYEGLSSQKGRDFDLPLCHAEERAQG